MAFSPFFTLYPLFAQLWKVRQLDFGSYLSASSAPQRLKICLRTMFEVVSEPVQFDCIVISLYLRLLNKSEKNNAVFVAYLVKIVKSGKEIEVYQYKDKEILRGYKRKERNNKKVKPFKGQLNFNEYKKELKRLEEWEKEYKAKTVFSISRTRTNIRRLANANPHLNKFLTLTFAESTTELTKANNLYNQAMKRIIRKRKDFEYIAVVEFQKDIDYHGNKKEKGGSVHYHLLCNIKMPKTENLKELFDWEKWFALRYWKYGFIKIADVRQEEILLFPKTKKTSRDDWL